MVREILAAVRGTLKKILPGRKLIWNWSTAVGFHYFQILKRRLVLNTSETGIEYFISLGSCRLDYSFVLFTTAHSWKYSWELERSFAVFQEEHGPNWQSWPTSCTNFNVAGNLSTVVLSCKNVCRQLKFSKLGSTSSFFFFSQGRIRLFIPPTRSSSTSMSSMTSGEQKFSVSVF